MTTPAKMGGVKVIAQGFAQTAYEVAPDVIPEEECSTNSCTPVVVTPVDPVPPGSPPGLIEFITASSSGSGIFVSWRYPNADRSVLGYIDLYKGLTSNFNDANLIGTSNSSSYYDHKSNLIVGYSYYYWVKAVSTTGGEGLPVGPAHAVAVSSVKDTLDDINGQINDTQLSQDLRTVIANITNGNSSLSDQAQINRFGIALFTTLLGDQFDQLNDIDTLIFENTLEYIKGDLAVAGRIQLLHAQSFENKATILKEQGVRASQFGSLVFDTTTLQATAGLLSASVQTIQESEIKINEDLTDLKAGYVLKTQTIGPGGIPYISGFGLYNTSDGDRSNSAFIVHADMFAIGVPNQAFTVYDEEQEKNVLVYPEEDVIYPFSVTYVNDKNGNKTPRIALNAKAIASDLTIQAGQVEGVLRSDVFRLKGFLGETQESFGWALFPNGTCILNNLIASGTIQASSFVEGGIETSFLGRESTTFAFGGLGMNYATSGQLLSRGYKAPEGGKLFLTVGGNMKCNAGSSAYITVTAGSQSTRHEVYANDGTNSSNAWIKVPASTSVTSLAGETGISASFSGSGAIYNVWWTVAIYKR